MVDELGSLTQTVKVQQVRGRRRRLWIRRGSVVGPTCRNGYGETVRMPSDNIRGGTPADADDFDLATAQRVKWMGNGHQFYRTLE